MEKLVQNYKSALILWGCGRHGSVGYGIFCVARTLVPLSLIWAAVVAFFDFFNKTVNMPNLPNVKDVYI